MCCRFMVERMALLLSFYFGKEVKISKFDIFGRLYRMFNCILFWCSFFFELIVTRVHLVLQQSWLLSSNWCTSKQASTGWNSCWLAAVIISCCTHASVTLYFCYLNASCNIVWWVIQSEINTFFWLTKIFQICSFLPVWNNVIFTCTIYYLNIHVIQICLL